MQNVRARLLKGTIWISAARGATNILGFVSTLILARVLVPADFGLVALGTTMLAILQAVTNISLSSALVQHRNPTPEHFHTAWTLGFARALLIGGLFAASSWTAARLYHEPRLVPVMLALSVSVMLNGLANPRSIMLTKELVFWQQFMMQVSQRIVALVVSIALALIYRNYWSLIWGTIVGQFVGVIISYTVLPFRPRLHWRHGRELFSFSMWLTFGQIVNTINWKFDHLLIGGYLGRAELGYYTVGDNLAVIPSREATLPLTSTLFPAFSNLAHDPPRLAAAYQRAQSLVTAIALPVGVGVAVTADLIVRLTMGDKWLPAVLVIQVLASVFALQTIGTLSQPLAMATGNTRLIFRRDLQGFLMRLPFIIAGMYLGGLKGIVYARALTGCIAIVLHMNVVRQVAGLSLRDQLRPNLRSLASVAAMAAATLGVYHLFGDHEGTVRLIEALAAMVATGAIVYLALHGLLWRLAGRPVGPETEVIEMAMRVVGRRSIRLV